MGLPQRNRVPDPLKIDTMATQGKGPGFIDDATLDRAIATWGVDAQFEMLLEETLELATALQKMKRSDKNREVLWANLIDELADVKILIRQAERMIGVEGINDRVDFKMERLENRLDAEIQ